MVAGGPPGITRIAACEDGIVLVQLGGDQERFLESLSLRSYTIGGKDHWVIPACNQLEEYLQKRRTVFRCKLVYPKLTPFSLRVFQCLKNTGYGNLVTYGQLAKQAGNPNAARAVGQLMANNPLPIFIPCHRVVAACGPGGFGPGLDMKFKLLELENCKMPFKASKSADLRVAARATHIYLKSL